MPTTTFSAWTSAEIDAEITATKTAIEAARTGKSYVFKGRSLTRNDLSELRAHLDYLVREKNKLARQGIRTRRGIVKP